MSKLNNKTSFITGATRGIGKAIALRFAREGANVVVTGKSVQPNPKAPATIYSTAHEVEHAGRRGLAIQLDVRDENAVAAAVRADAEKFGGIDILVNNASAIALTGTLATPAKRYDLMNQINARGTFICSQAWLPHLFQSANPHILTLSPPLNLDRQWFKDHVACTMPNRRVAGNFFIDEEAPREEGITDFAKYAVPPGATLRPDLFLD